MAENPTIDRDDRVQFTTDMNGLRPQPCLAYDTPNLRRSSLWKRSKNAYKSSALKASDACSRSV
jgi:hypothetical protein